MGSPTNPLEGQPKTRISKAADHADDCDWHLDQYPWECTCGAAWAEYRPRRDGEPPADYVPGSMVDVRKNRLTRDWVRISWEPYWNSRAVYRYQPAPPKGTVGVDALREQIDPSITDWGEPLPASPKGTVGLDGSISGRRASVVIMDDIEADNRSSLPEDDGDRLAYPMFDGLLAYFPNALAEVAMVSMIGNQQHNPGQPMHWARGKSTDHANKAVRHLVDHGKRDARGVRHTARAAWRILALLQEEIERDEGRPLSRASRAPEPDEA